jgi:hypothetical protein
MLQARLDCPPVLIQAYTDDYLYVRLAQNKVSRVTAIETDMAMTFLSHEGSGRDGTRA